MQMVLFYFCPHNALHEKCSIIPHHHPSSQTLGGGGEPLEQGNSVPQSEPVSLTEDRVMVGFTATMLSNMQSWGESTSIFNPLFTLVNKLRRHI